MWSAASSEDRRAKQFFYVGLSHESLMNLYKTNFALMQHHKYSLTELENMIPFEREIYLGMIAKYLEEEKRKAENRKYAATRGR